MWYCPSCVGMSQRWPSKSDSEPSQPPDGEEDVEDGPSPEELRTMWLDSDDAGDLISSLSSETARSILVRLHEDAATASELADAVDTSVQNVRHHLDSLTEAGLVEVSDTRYSSKGREMDVYAPVEEPMVVFVGREDRGSGFVDSLKRFLGAIGILAAASFVIQYLVITRYTSGGGAITRIPADDGAGGLAPLGLPPGALFFAGGALVLAVASAWRYWDRRRTGGAPADG